MTGIADLNPLIPGAAGAVLAVAGPVLLRRAWLKSDGAAALTAGGWALLILCFPLWALAGGIDRGTAMGVVAVMAAALALIAATAPRPLRRPSTGAVREPRASVAPRRTAGDLLRRAGRFVTTGPLAAAAAVALTLALALHGPGAEATRTVTAVLLLPLMWGAGMAWAASDIRPLRPAVGLTLAGTIGALATLYGG